MLPPELAADTVIRLRGGEGSDAHWNDATDWSTAATVAIPGCSVQGQLGTERLGDRDSVTWVFIWFGPPDADVRSYDRIRFDGVDYDVDGPVVRVSDPTGAGLDHKMCKLQLVEG